jgi:transcriptional regulator with PAS, ATPase and Fis domain
VALAQWPVILSEDLPDYIRNQTIETYRSNPATVPTLMEQEKHYVQWVLEKAGGNKTKAAKIMGIDRVSLWRKIKRFGLE